MTGQNVSNLSKIIRRYVDEAARIAAAVAAKDGPDKQRAEVLAEYARQIRDFLSSPTTDGPARSTVEHAIMFAIGIEGLTTDHLWKKPVDDYIARVERLRKTPTIGTADLLRAEAQHKTRAKQANALGVSVRHLSRLRAQLLK